MRLKFSPWGIYPAFLRALLCAGCVYVCWVGAWVRCWFGVGFGWVLGSGLGPGFGFGFGLFFGFVFGLFLRCFFWIGLLAGSGKNMALFFSVSESESGITGPL